jgi:BirA family biotin operon repressor/biotin-[acetyl-CoA-carboxylase] ligase
MFESEVRAALRNLPLGGLRVYESVGSTNDEAIAWAGDGAADSSVIVADEQTLGRGRAGRTWFTPPGSAIALSMILRPPEGTTAHSSRLAGLGAVSIVGALDGFGLQPSIKWPNDILLGNQKVGGVLVESIWTGDVLEATILGIGVNVLVGAVPPRELLNFPATSLESELGSSPDRLALLAVIIEGVLRWRPLLPSRQMVDNWEARLAFRGQSVAVSVDNKQALVGTCRGLADDGSLVLEASGKELLIPMGEVHLLPANDRMA